MDLFIVLIVRGFVVGIVAGGVDNGRTHLITFVIADGTTSKSFTTATTGTTAVGGRNQKRLKVQQCGGGGRGGRPGRHCRLKFGCGRKRKGSIARNSNFQFSWRGQGVQGVLCRQLKGKASGGTKKKWVPVLLRLGWKKMASDLEMLIEVP